MAERPAGSVVPMRQAWTTINVITSRCVNARSASNDRSVSIRPSIRASARRHDSLCPGKAGRMGQVLVEMGNLGRMVGVCPFDV